MPKVFINNQHFKCKQVLKPVPSPKDSVLNQQKELHFFLPWSYLIVLREIVLCLHSKANVRISIAFSAAERYKYTSCLNVYSV